MNDKQIGILAILGIGIIMGIWYAQNQTNDQPMVPAFQTEAQVMGLGVEAGLQLGHGTPLDIRPEVHFWSPGFNPRDSQCATPTVKCRVRYPAVPGGNTSTVMHKGWSQFAQLAPADADWFLNPPEVAPL